MFMKRFLSVLLTLCLLLGVISPSATAVTSWWERSGASREKLLFELLNGDLFDLDLFRKWDTDLSIEKIEDDQEVKIFIIMDSLSVVEQNPKAVYGPEAQKTMDALSAQQNQVLSAIGTQLGQSLTVNYSYTWLLNGVATQVPYGLVREIEKIPGVKQVLLQPKYAPAQAQPGQAQLYTHTTGSMIGREPVWAQGYTGMGIKIAVIDTGLDDDHPNFQALPQEKLTADSYDESHIAAVLDQLNATARFNAKAEQNHFDIRLSSSLLYRSSKVIFGFNYGDDSLDITHDNDTNGDHGTHVAGIAAANKVDGVEVQGVAHDAQLMIMKVFGYERAGYAQDILAALEDALILGADVVNMSLGTTAGFVTSVPEVNAIYDRVAQTNTVLSVAAGNSYTAGYGNVWGTDMNQTMYPDNAVVSQPAIYNNALCVASMENSHIMRRYIAAADLKLAFVETSLSYGVPSIDVLEGAAFPLVAIPNYGAAEDYAGLDVAGKIVLVQRGGIAFMEKCENATAAGAAACIVYNNTDGEFGMDLTDCKATIPCVSIMLEDAEKLLSALEKDPGLTMRFSEDMTALPSQFAGQMSDFSSWGVAPNLTLEPDITAPGGNVYSTYTDGQYGLMSGTSMAAPNMAGLIALVMQYVRESGIETDLPMREFVQDLLVSTATPLIHANGNYYSPRQQGSGLGNAFLALSTGAYLTVSGSDVPKVSLGDDPNRTGRYDYYFRVHNFGSETLYYRLDTVTQTEGVTTFEQYPGRYFMSGIPESLRARTEELSDDLLYTYDISGDGVTDAYDAYLLSQKKGLAEDNAFRYDVDGDEESDMDDVQAYLDALVGLQSEAELDDQVLQVKAGDTAKVRVKVRLYSQAMEWLDTNYPNGGYVEGFTFLDAVNGTDLSLPYLAFYGDWNDAPVLDDGFYWDLLTAEEPDPEEPPVVVGNQYTNVLWTEFYGIHASFYPGMNPYLSEDFSMDHISLSPNGDGYVDTVDDIYVSLLRNAESVTFRYVNADTGEVYYEQTTWQAAKSAYSPGYGQIVPLIYSWLTGEILPYNFTGPDGKVLPNNTHLKLQVEAVGAYEGATTDSWEVPITIDLEKPELVKAEKVTDENGKIWLELAFRDNLSVSAVAVLNSNGQETYYLEPTVDEAPDENGYRNYTARFDITDLSGKLMIVLADYALNEANYGINVAGAGTDYGDLVGYQYNFSTDTNGWVSFSEGVAQNEVQITMDSMDFLSAEYVGGYVFAQTASGALYGFRYEDMLADRIDVAETFITQLERTYHDMAYDYVTGQLYGLMSVEDSDGYPTTEIYTINIGAEYVDEATGETIEAYQETWIQGRGGLYGLCITVDDQGTIYLLGTNDKGKTELWSSYDSSYGKLFKKTMSLDAPIDYAQSIAFNHNNGKLYWSQFYPTSIDTFLTELYVLDVQNGSYESVGTLSGETCGLFAPLTPETVASNPIYQNIPPMDPNVVGTPKLRKDNVNMNVGAQEQLLFDFDPWFTSHRDVVWFSSDESVVSVSQQGHITALGRGTAIITVQNASDPAAFDTCVITVTELTLEIEGIVSNMGAGVGNAAGAKLYKYTMDKSIPSMEEGMPITAPVDMNFGLDIATSVYARGYIWACEYGNTGMVYKIDPATGEVVDFLMPVDGDMLFGMTYNENLDTFAAIMNMYLFVDLELTHEEQDKMLDSFDPETNSFNYHRLNLLPYLLMAEGNFITGEYGQGASSEIVMCGVTTLAESFHYEDTGLDFLGNDAFDEVRYNSTQTLVILDNVGRLWYIDEICGLTKEENAWSTTYTSAADPYVNITSYTGSQRQGILELPNEDGTYNVFYIRAIEETPLTDLFRQESMPRITYHFSDIEFGGYTADGAPIFAMSLYDYWNNGTTNELYIYVPEWSQYDEATGQMLGTSAEKFYYLGTTGQYNIIASIHRFQVLPWVQRAFANVSVDYRTVQSQIFEMLNKVGGEEITMTAGTPGIAYLASDSLSWMNAGSGWALSTSEGMYGICAPLLRDGIPVKMKAMEQISTKDDLKGVNLLLVSFDSSVPLSEEVNIAIADWVKAGGTMLYVAGQNDYWDIDDYFFWADDKTPLTNLLGHLGLGSIKVNTEGINLSAVLTSSDSDLAAAFKDVKVPASYNRYSVTFTGAAKPILRSGAVTLGFEESVGKGHVVMVGLPSALYAGVEGGSTFMRALTAYALQYTDFEYASTSLMVTERGNYTIAHAFGEDEYLEGEYIDLFDSNLTILNDPDVPKDDSVILYDISSIKRDIPRLGYTSGEVLSLVESAAKTTIKMTSAANVNVSIRMLLPKGIYPEKATATGADGKEYPLLAYFYDKENSSCLFKVDGNSDAITVDFEWGTDPKAYTLVAKEFVEDNYLTNANNPEDAEFIEPESNAAANHGVRFCDGALQLVYKFDLTQYDTPLFRFHVSQNYYIEISADKKDWQLVVDYSKGGTVDRMQNGANAEVISIDPADYGLTDTMYFRLKNTATTGGFGGAISKFSIRHMVEKAGESDLTDAPANRLEGVNNTTASIKDTVNRNASSTDAKYLVSTKDGIATYKRSMVTSALGQDAEFIYANTSNATNTLRFCDGDRVLVYFFDVTDKLSMEISLNIFQNYILEVSADGEDWEEIANYYDISGGQHLTSGGNNKVYKVNPFDYGCKQTGTCYIRLRNCDPSKGHGGSITNLTLNYTKAAK